jgi:hypothetical protein
MDGSKWARLAKLGSRAYIFIQVLQFGNKLEARGNDSAT